VNLLEACKSRQAGFLLLSTSRVYSVRALAEVPVRPRDARFVPDLERSHPAGLSEAGIAENFSTTPPLSLYGSSKLASEILALEYGAAFEFPVWINRCGVMAGAGQFGKPDQGILSFWINSWLRDRPLQYIGFEGTGFQVRDFLHPHDLLPLLDRQMNEPEAVGEKVLNVSGGLEQTLSLAEMSAWCRCTLGERQVTANTEPRPYDAPWIVLDSRPARRQWQWQPRITVQQMLEEIASHAQAHPDWLKISGVTP
jgi:CDP-paratose 2-epimerase